ncbi:MAG: phosphate signaling complex protein PhoU [Opitutales bacterium]|nr:phosphate signaling complex protein PhoU [Opitutales bacterium]
MNSHLRHDLETLKDKLLVLATYVEENMRLSVKALLTLSEDLAEKVVKKDLEIDKVEVQMEEECLKILALHQPVASDLRFVVTVLKINNELEHIGDMAANMAKRIPFIKRCPTAYIPFDIEDMSVRTIEMLKTAIDAFTTENELLAVKVCSDDDNIDTIMRNCYQAAESEMENKGNMGTVNYLLICKSFERIADLCTNIAEDIIYMRHSIIVRHNLSEAVKSIAAENETKL